MKLTINTTTTAHVYIPRALFDRLDELSCTNYSNWNNCYESTMDEFRDETSDMDPLADDEAQAQFNKDMRFIAQQIPKDADDVMFYAEAEHNLNEVQRG